MATQSSGNETPYGCGNPRFNPYDVVSFMAGPAMFLVIVFSFFVKRKKLFPNFLNGRPGTVYAVNLLDSYNDRVGHACAIGVSCVSVLELFFGNYYVNINYDEIPVMVRGATRTLVLTANVWMIALVYFPISLCLTTKRKVLGNCVGFIYTSVWSAFYAQRLAECPRDTGRIGELNFLMVVPLFVLYLGLHLQFAWGIWQSWRDRNKIIEHYDGKGHILTERFVKSHYYQRVRYLLTPKRILENRVHPKPSDEKQYCKKLQRLFEKVYRSEPGFKFSKRMVVTAVLTALSLYELGIGYIGGLGIAFEYGLEYFDEEGTFKEFFDFTNTTDSFYEIKAFYTILMDSFWPTCVAAMGIAIGFNIHFLYLYRILEYTNYFAMSLIAMMWSRKAQIRQNTLALWRGVKTLIPEEDLPNSYVVASSLRYSGYHVGFALWGFLILQILFWLITFVCWYFIARPVSLGDSNFLTTLIRNQWLTALIALIIYYGQILLARVFYLEGKGEVLSLTNRRSLHNTTFFLLFLNILLGLFSCLLRIGYSVMFGILLVGRIDRCLLMKGYELWDSGFKSYVAFLELEVAQTHPVVVSFCYMMWKMTGKRSRLHSVDGYDTIGEMKFLQTVEAQTDDRSSDKRKRVARNRWLVAYTLAQNPSLVIDRSPEAFRLLLMGDNGNNVTEPDGQMPNKSISCGGESEESSPSAPLSSSSSSSSSLRNSSISSAEVSAFASANHIAEEKILSEENQGYEREESLNGATEDKPAIAPASLQGSIRITKV